MAAAATAANLATEGTSAGVSAITAAGAAIKAFVLTNPATLAGVAGIVIGALGYRLLAHHDHEHNHDHEGEDEAAEAAEAPAS